MNHVGHERYCTSSIFRVEVCQYLQNRYSLSVGQTVLSGYQEGPISLTNVPNNSKLQKNACMCKRLPRGPYCVQP